MEDGKTFSSTKSNSSIMKFSYLGISNYNEQLRVIDFPVYVSGENDSNLTPLTPVY
jgi:hypothetical protein